jgi:hypothetical protein
VRTLPRVTGTPAVGDALTCRPGRWARWDGAEPSPRLLSFDGYRWLRDGRPIAGARAPVLVPTATDRGARISCRVTVTYPAPLLVTAPATSATVRIRLRRA